jgi:3alpha(or 20beta)-hydroxysteroid dehydrogenase
VVGRLDGKVAVISGAARGQGEAHARLFAAEGAKVVLGDVLDDLGEKVTIDIGDAAVYRHLDVTSEDDWASVVDTAVSEFGMLNVLINNAGILRTGMIEATSLDEYMAVIKCNQVGCFLGMKAAIAVMREAGGGSIVNTSSTSGLIGMPAMTAYTASKFAVRGMTKCAAMELGRYGIRVNSVHPGGVDTEMIRRPEFAGVQEGNAYAWQPVPRVGQPEEIARLMLFLASDESSYCSGAEFVIDGGMTAGPPIWQPEE